MWLYHHQPIIWVCGHSSTSFFSHQNNLDGHKHKEPPQNLLQARTAQQVGNTPVPALGAALSAGMSSPRAIPGLRSSVGITFWWLTAEFCSTLNAIVHCCSVQQLFQTPSFPTCNPTGVTWQSTSYSSKANSVSVPKPAWCLPAFSFVYFSTFKLEESSAQLPEITQWEHEYPQSELSICYTAGTSSVWALPCEA